VSERDDETAELPFLDGSERPPTDAERIADEALGEVLRSAYDPAPLDPARQKKLLELALTDPLAPPTEEEARESERLRQALDSGDESHADVRLLRALSAATSRSPRRGATEPSVPSPATARKTNVVFVTFGAGVLALAAAFALFVGGGLGADRAPTAGRLAPSRTTADLFEREFEPGETTERIDRIASARAHDLRENRYALWGAR
jgi:hypothetical protein